MSETENPKEETAFLSPLLVLWGLSPALVLVVVGQQLDVSHVHPESPRYPRHEIDMLMLVVLLMEVSWACIVVRRIRAHWIARLVFIIPITVVIMYINFFVAGLGCGVYEGLTKLIN